MTRNIILVAGLQKTATTSIQETCLANQDKLRGAGYYYMGYRMPADDTPRANHTNLLRLMFDDVQGIDRSARPALREAVRSSFRGIGGTVLLVAEGVSAMSERSLAAMRDWFAANDFNVQVICRVRHVSTWVHSLVAQRVAGNRRGTIEDQVSEFREGRMLVRRLRRLAAAFPHTRFESFEEGLQHPSGPVGMFLEKLGVPLDGITFHEDRAGRSDCAVRVLSVLQERFPNDGGPVTPVTEALRAIPGPKFMLQQQEAPWLAELVDQENAWIATTLGPAYSGGPLEFGPVPWTAEAVGQLREVLDGMPADQREWLVSQRARWDTHQPL